MAPVVSRKHNSASLQPKLIDDPNVNFELEIVDELEENKMENEDFLQKPVQIVKINHEKNIFEICEEGLKVMLYFC